MNDRLDTMGRDAAADLHERVRDVDTEAALDRLGAGDAGPVRSSAPAGRWRRPVLAVAAVFVLVAVAGVGRLLRDGSDTDAPASQPTTAIPPAPSVDPASFGPVVERITGATTPGLRAELHAPDRIDDGTQVAVAISGGGPASATSSASARRSSNRLT